MRKWDAARYTLSQLHNALDYSDHSDPHAGNVPLAGPDDLRAILDMHGLD
jgi:hypothetical protein